MKRFLVLPLLAVAASAPADEPKLSTVRPEGKLELVATFDGPMPTGVTVSMQDQKSQLQNKAKAMQVLRSRLLKLEQDRQSSELSEARRDQVGGGGRSEKVRTYNFKENRVSDHRIDLTLYKLDKMLAGELDDVVDALVADERATQLQGS